MRVVAGVDLGGTAINYTFMDAAGTVPDRGSASIRRGPKKDRMFACSRSRTARRSPSERAGSTLSDDRGGGSGYAGSGQRDGRAERGGLHQFRASEIGPGSISGQSGHAARQARDVSERRQRRRALGALSIFGASQPGNVDFGGNRHGPRRRRHHRGQRREGAQGLRRRTGPRADSVSEYSPGSQGCMPHCNCGRTGDLESVCSLTAIGKSFLPYFLPQLSGARTGQDRRFHQAAKLVRGMAEKGDPMCREIFRVQAHALGLFFDEMINTFDPDALIVGGGAIETSEANSSSGSWTRSGRACRRSGKSRRTFRSTSCPTAIRRGRAARPSKRCKYARQHNLL